MGHTQNRRFIGIETPLGNDVVLLKEFSGSEAISQPFRFQTQLLAEQPVSFDKIIGQRVTIRINLREKPPRYINGVVSRFADGGESERLFSYQAEIVPWLWLLTRTADCRIFQDMTIPDIIAQVFTDLGFHDFRNTLTGKFEKREYCVQYRETDFNFVSRLMEQYGICYYFEHEQYVHRLVMADAASAHKPCSGQEKARFDRFEGRVQSEDVVTAVQAEQVMCSGKYALSDYNFKTPSLDLGVTVNSVVHVGGNEKYEIFDYPGEYAKKDEGDMLVKLRMEEVEATHLVVRGRSSCRAFTPGYRFELSDYPQAERNTTYLLTDVHHEASVGQSYEKGTENHGETSYANQFVSIPYSTQYRPSRSTPKPVIPGEQTAIVVGEAGKEVDVDPMGRVKVQFFWDREGTKDQRSSCWIPVSQVHAGKGFGAVDIPRIGEEVIVGFIEGDPDCPIIIGRVYNGQNMPPTKSGIVSGIKSNTSPGGGGSNSIMLDDSKGKEAITIHGQHNMSTTVENDHSLTVTSGNDTHTVSAGTQTVTVKGKTSLTVQAGDRVVNVTGNYKCDTTSEINLQAPTKITLTCGGSTITMEPGKIVLKAGGGASVTLDGDALMVSSGGAQVLLNADVHAQSSGGSALTLDGNAKMSGAGEATVEGAMKSTFCGGGATLVNDAVGVAATGPKISLNG